MKKYNIAVVGATGVVGRELISILDERNFPVKSVKLLASDESLGKSLPYKNKETYVDVLDKQSFKGVDIAFFCATKNTSKEFAETATQSGCVVIDVSGYFRNEKDIPMVAADINNEDMDFYKNRGIICLPSCSSTVTSLALKPIIDNYGIERVVVSIYASVGAFGMSATEELFNQTKAWFEFRHDDIKPKIFNQKIVFNCISGIGDLSDDGFFEEEDRLMNEMGRIFHEKNMSVFATQAVLPIFRGHLESVNVTTKKPFDIDSIKNLINNSNGCKMVDNHEDLRYSTAIDTVGKDDVFLSRLRADRVSDNEFGVWISADNLRIGSALNAVKIAEVLIEEYL